MQKDHQNGTQIEKQKQPILPMSWSPATIDLARARPTLKVVLGSLGGGAGGAWDDRTKRETHTQTQLVRWRR